MVHVLGNSTDMQALLSLLEDHQILLIEDTCESLGSTYEGRSLGTLGEFGTYSFYFSHHMTIIEGGMVVARTAEDNDLLRCLRAHGWSREQSNKNQLERENPQIDPRFLFVNSGYNLRPMEIQAAFGLEQLTRLEGMNQQRRANAALMRDIFLQHPKWKGQLEFPMAGRNLNACWFGFPFLLAKDANVDRNRFTELLMHAGIDTRPIVSGNMALQPAVKLFDVDQSLGPFRGAQQIHDRGVFVGVHAKPITRDRIEWLADTVLDAVGKASR